MFGSSISSSPFAFVDSIGSRRHYKRTNQLHLAASSDGDEDEEEDELAMENIYTEWTLENDKLLWEHRASSSADQAVLLGRGLRGVEARLSKLRDVNSPAYDRLFAQGSNNNQKMHGDGGEEGDDDVTEKKKLVPVSEVIRRIQWDYSLDSKDFSILHYDRVDDAVVESPMDAPNQSIKGKSRQLVDALPEHRIVAIKFREQVVWDRNKRMDKVFSDGGIETVMAEYDEWKRAQDANWEWLRKRQTQVATQVRQVLGLERYTTFRTMSKEFQSTLEDSGVSTKAEGETYVKASLNLFRQVLDDPSDSLEPSLVPQSDAEAAECLSELVALSPNALLRECVLAELAVVLNRLDGGGGGQLQSTSSQATSDNAGGTRALPELSEDDITETFVRGSGAGGQKVNKTSSKVALLHIPTKLRVECQDTRSLQQNRKIARKRLRLKLDEFLNGSQSRTGIKAEKASNKKAKAKARSRARNRKKTEAKNESN